MATAYKFIDGAYIVKGIGGDKRVSIPVDTAVIGNTTAVREDDQYYCIYKDRFVRIGDTLLVIGGRAEDYGLVIRHIDPPLDEEQAKLLGEVSEDGKQ